MQPLCTDRIARLVSVTSKLTLIMLPFIFGERHVALDVVMLLRFSPYAFQTHAMADRLRGDRHCVIHWARGHNTSRLYNRTVVSTPNREKHLSRVLVRLLFMSAR